MHHLAGHPNIVTLKGAFEDKHDVHIVMELCSGGELFDRIAARGHYSERAAAILTKTIVSVVDYCHKNNVIHRDLKPENFLLADKREDAPLKVTDFGLSVFYKEGEVFTDTVGSAFYVAPEVLKGKYGKEADVWSCGVILYILLSGTPPFWGGKCERGITSFSLLRSEDDVLLYECLLRGLALRYQKIFLESDARSHSLPYVLPLFHLRSREREADLHPGARVSS